CAVNPSVFSTAISLVLSLIDCHMELPTINKMVKNAANTTAIIIKPMSPICSINALLNAASVLVSVSAGELANISSIALETVSLSSGSVVVIGNHPIQSPPQI